MLNGQRLSMTDLPADISAGKGTTTPTEWCLRRFLHLTYTHHYPLLSYIAEVRISTPVSKVWPERSTSVLKWQSTRFRSRVRNDLLGAPMQISINGPKLGPLSDDLLNEVVRVWLSEKKRRKLPKQCRSRATIIQQCPETETGNHTVTHPCEDLESDTESIPMESEAASVEDIVEALNLNVPAAELKCDEECTSTAVKNTFSFLDILHKTKRQCQS